ncbi:MAG TPA: diguanylate cyclase [Chloroflexota bacterium]
MQGNLASLAPDQLSVVLQYLPEGLVIVDAERRILALNAAAEALTGLKAGDVVGQRTCRETITCTDRRGQPLCDACPHFTAAATHTAVSNASVSVRRPTGLPLPVTATYFPLPGPPDAPRVDALILAELPTRPAGLVPTARGAVDAATGLCSRERFEALYARERERAQRYQSGLGVLRVTVRPHPAAPDAPPRPPATTADLDAALAVVAETLLDALRTVDIVGRCDDYDCAVLLPAANFAGARSLVERLERALGALAEDGTIPPSVEVSLGVALNEGYDNLLARCSQRLGPVAGSS